MVRLAEIVSTKGAGTCFRPRKEAWGGFPLFAFVRVVRGGDVMRKAFVLLVVCLVLLWAGHALAYYRDLARPRFGDPDEFQTHKYRDENGVRLASFCRGKRNSAAVSQGREGPTEREIRRCLSISFAGRTFFLEK
jgi:hypothetical protein